MKVININNMKNPKLSTKVYVIQHVSFTSICSEIIRKNTFYLVKCASLKRVYSSDKSACAANFMIYLIGPILDKSLKHTVRYKRNTGTITTS